MRQEQASITAKLFQVILTYDNFIENLFARFPDFEKTLDAETLSNTEDNPIVLFSFFVSYFHKKLGDEGFEKELVGLLDDMSDIESLHPVLEDFLLSIYLLMSGKGTDINPFINRLTPRTKMIYDLCVRMWKKGNGIET